MTNACPTQSKLLQHLLEPGKGETTRKHVELCSICEATSAQFQDVIDSASLFDREPHNRHLSELEIAELVDGSDQTGSEALTHLSTCKQCREVVSSVSDAVSAITDQAPVTENGIAPHRFIRNRVTIKRSLPVLAMAAVAAWFLIATPESPPPTSGVHRASGGPNTIGLPTPISPRGEVTAAPLLTWASVPGADMYEIIIFDDAAIAIGRLRTRDTVASMPDSVVLNPDISYTWAVRARTGFDRWSETAEAIFVLGPTGEESP